MEGTGVLCKQKICLKWRNGTWLMEFHTNDMDLNRLIMLTSINVQHHSTLYYQTYERRIKIRSYTINSCLSNFISYWVSIRYATLHLGSQQCVSHRQSHDVFSPVWSKSAMSIAYNEGLHSEVTRPILLPFLLLIGEDERSKVTLLDPLACYR